MPDNKSTPGGGRKITIDDIARDLNISKTTVSRAISGKGRIGRDTVKRVNDYIESHNYHPSAIARSLACSRSMNIAFVMNEAGEDLNLPYIQKFLWGSTKRASASGFDILICVASDGDIAQLKRLVRDKKIDGAIVARAIEGDPAMKYLDRHGIPFVVAGSPEKLPGSPENVSESLKNVSDSPENVSDLTIIPKKTEGNLGKDTSTVTDKDADRDEFCYLDHDHVKACRELTASLIEKGCKKLSYIGGNTSFIVSKHRLKGFTDGVIRSGRSTENMPIFTHVTSDEEVVKIMPQLLLKKPELIICDDDQICTSVLHYLNENDIRIPYDIKVASFYNSVFLDNYKPAVTAIEFDAQHLGGACANLLINRILDSDSGADESKLDYRILYRGSTEG